MSETGSTGTETPTKDRDEREAFEANNEPLIVVNNPENYEEATKPFNVQDATAYGVFAVESEANTSRYLTAKFRVGSDGIAGIVDVGGEKTSLRVDEEIDRIEYYGELDDEGDTDDV